MRTIRACLFLAAVWLAPGLAQAQAWSACESGGGDPMQGTAELRDGQCAEYEFTGSTDSAMLVVRAKLTDVCFDPNVETSGTATATVYLRKIVGGGSASANTGGKVLVDVDGAPGADNVPLNGDDGSSGEQRMCIYEVPPGRYYIDVDTASGGETARVEARAR